MVDSKPDDLCQEGAREPSGDKQAVAHGTLIKTLADNSTCKLIVFECYVRRVLVVRVNLMCVCVCACVCVCVFVKERER